MARSVVTSVSQATRLVGSAARQWSRMASLIWSATLSGWPMDTDSLVNKYRSALTALALEKRVDRGRQTVAAGRKGGSRPPQDSSEGVSAGYRLLSASPISTKDEGVKTAQFCMPASRGRQAPVRCN